MAQGNAISSLVTCEWLQDKISKGDVADIVILDVSWSSQKDCQAEFNKHHIPGARYLDVMVGPHSSLFPRNIPPPDVFQKAARAAGVNEDSHVILYSDSDNCGFFLSGRAWWTFTIYGAKHVSILNGGLQRWLTLGYDVTCDTVHVQVQGGNFTAQYNNKHRLTFEEMEERLSTDYANVLDSRAPHIYSDGHIPGAHSLPYSQLMDNTTQQMKSPEAIREVFKEAGVDVSKPLTTYCNSGMSSCTLAFAYNLCGGSDFAVFHGGFTEWKNKAKDEDQIKKS